jgi:hypothetical protein
MAKFSIVTVMTGIGTTAMAKKQIRSLKRKEEHSL